eukprot:UN26992
MAMDPSVPKHQKANQIEISVPQLYFNLQSQVISHAEDGDMERVKIGWLLKSKDGFEIMSIEMCVPLCWSVFDLKVYLACKEGHKVEDCIWLADGDYPSRRDAFEDTKFEEFEDCYDSENAVGFIEET